MNFSLPFTRFVPESVSSQPPTPAAAATIAAATNPLRTPLLMSA